MNPVAPRSAAARLSPAEPETRVAPVHGFGSPLRENLAAVPETWQALRAPGDKLNLTSGRRLPEIRDQIEPPTPHEGLHFVAPGRVRVDAIANPDAADGRWDPYAFMPRFAFAPDEDAFPIDPTYDGDLAFDNNAPDSPNGPDNHYKDGVIGGNQALSAGFLVSKKGPYTVLTYSFYYATNKALEYHKNDYSTAQVYLKPGADGKLQPAYLATSWHYGSILTAWKDLAKDADGRPVIRINQGSHATLPVAKGDRLPKAGVQIAGNGQASLNGQPLGHALRFEAFQPTVANARVLDPNAAASGPRVNAMSWGGPSLDPFLPEVYQAQGHPWQELAERGWNAVKAQVSKLTAKAKQLLPGF
jgi:hypothetical protein